MTNNSFLTVVFRDLTPEEVYDLTHHDKLSATSWSHAMDERDELKWRLQKLLDERC